MTVRETMLMRMFSAILGLFAVGFMAWAGVLWDRSSVIIDNQTRILVQQGIFLTRLADLEQDAMSHENRSWHSEAGNALIDLKARLNYLESRSGRPDG